MKQLDTEAYLSTLKELVEQGKEVRLVVSGSSMSPFLIHGRDSILFSKPATPLQKGDMVFYRRPNGSFVMHRILRITPKGLYLIGDAQTEVEGPLKPACVFARVNRVCRKGKWMGSEGFWWKFFRHVWLRLIPLRPALIRLYRLLAG